MLNKFKIFEKECRNIHNSEVKENREMYQLIKKLLEECPPTDSARINTLNDFISYNNLKLKYVKDLKPLEYLELPESNSIDPPTPSLESVHDTTQTNSKNVLMGLPDLSGKNRFSQNNLDLNDDDEDDEPLRIEFQ